MKSASSFLTAFTCGSLAVFAAGAAQGQTKKADQALLAKTRIRYADAEKTALAAVPNAAVKASELASEDGGLRWSFDLVKPGGKNVTEVGVDAVTGKIVENKEESAKDEADEEKAEKKEHRKKND